MSWRLSDSELAGPRHGPDVCPVCFNFEVRRGSVCRACQTMPQRLECVVPISYSIGGGGLHTELAAYKRDADPFVTDAVRDLALILDRFLSRHERCVGGGGPFEVVTTVPSSDPQRDARHPLRSIVADLVPATRLRHRRLLRPAQACAPHVFDAARFEACRQLAGERVLLIDDTWTTGASAQSAAARLLAAGASSVAAVVIGRYMRASHGANRERLARLGGAFDWETCALCASDPDRGAAQTARPAGTLR